MDGGSMKQMRHKSFSEKINHDDTLDALVSGYPSHRFIANPPSHFVNQYLVNYVLKFSENHLNKKADTLKILDWGCGKGHITYLFRQQGIPVASCDIVDEKDDSAFGQDTPILDKLNIDVVPLTHPFELPFDSSSFDVIVSFGVLEHVPNDLNSLKEIHRVLKPGGLFFCFFLPYTYSWTQKIAHLQGDFYHDHFYNEKIVRNLLRDSKLTLLDFWHRALLPKTVGNYPAHQTVERFDQFVCRYTFLRHLATNVEFVAQKDLTYQ